MSDFDDSSLTLHTNEEFSGANHAGPSSPSAAYEGQHNYLQCLKDVSAVAGPSNEEHNVKPRRKIRRGANPYRYRTQISPTPRSFTSAIEQLHHVPTLSLERLAFRMDLEDLRRNMMAQRQETFQPYPPPRNSREIISIGPRHEHYSRSPADQGHRTSAPYSTAKTTRKARDLSKRGIGRDSQNGSDHRGERAIPPSRVYE